MNVYEYKGAVYNIAELSDMSGIEPHTIRDRLRRGYTIEEAIQINALHDSVKDFCDSSWYLDWLGMSTQYLHKIYWKWCISNGYNPLEQRGFTRQIFKLYPQLKTVATRKDNGCFRIIRQR